MSTKLLIRCSRLGTIMTTPKAKGETLSVGAKTYIETLAKQHVYDYTTSVTTKEMQKGIIVEQESINLLNDISFSSLTKNQEHRSNDWICGTCDIDSGAAIDDIKSSWSLATFPATAKDADDKLYEWQVRGYMMLWDRDRAAVDHCLVDTPDELIGYEDEALHRVSHIDPLLRVTRVHYDRNRSLEDLIKVKCEAAQRYFLEAITAIYDNHQ